MANMALESRRTPTYAPLGGIFRGVIFFLIALSWPPFPRIFSSAQAESLRVPAKVFPLGETLVYEVRWDAPAWVFFMPTISAGEMTFRFQEKLNYQGVPAYRITAEAISSGFLPRITGISVQDSFESIVDAQEFCSFRMIKKTREGKRQRDIFLTFDRKNGKGHFSAYDVSKQPPVELKNEEVKNIPACVQDLLSAIYHTRLRDLKIGEQVIVGVEGIRTVRNPQNRQERGESTGTHEFSFMGAGVSSERRVELVVEQIAWELRRIREQEGKVVVVAGPVVVHTGGGEHLAQLIRESYVRALLGGNAIAVHDLEQALLGTSLGVDLQRGVPVRGGHRHHLKAINIIRRCGSIARAVEQKVLTSGIFYECIRHKVPFSLAGSIRDDGPLPETEMDLVRAQADYARLLEGADMILMLSSMLHSIGVGNMTPAGIKLVCVDINPAVVTKLSDRGSLESIGVVTDVGLFLSLLVQQLNKLHTATVAA